MKLSKAIEIQEYHSKAIGDVAGSDFSNALKLLIEAGKRISEKREHPKRKFPFLLSGETEE